MWFSCLIRYFFALQKHTHAAISIHTSMVMIDFLFKFIVVILWHSFIPLFFIRLYLISHMCYNYSLLQQGILGQSKSISGRKSEKSSGSSVRSAESRGGYGTSGADIGILCGGMYGFPSLGEYHENLTFEEAVHLYEAIPSERMSAVKGIGFMLHTEGTKRYMDSEFDLVGGKAMDMINHVPEFRDSPLVQQAIKDTIFRENDTEFKLFFYDFESCS